MNLLPSQLKYPSYLWKVLNTKQLKYDRSTLPGIFLWRELNGTAQGPFRMGWVEDDEVQGCLEQT